jgi:hypothetical protein
MLVSSDPRDLIIIGFAGLALIIIGVAIGRLLWGRKYERLTADRNERLFTIERALRDFWEMNKSTLDAELQRQRSRVEQLESQNENYRKKLAKVGLFGLGRKESHLVLSLLMENEALEERLFQMNKKLHDERSEYLDDNLRRISYNRILISEILSSENVQREVSKLLRNNDSIRRIELKAIDGTAGAGWNEPEGEDLPR